MGKTCSYTVTTQARIERTSIDTVGRQRHCNSCHCWVNSVAVHCCWHTSWSQPIDEEDWVVANRGSCGEQDLLKSDRSSSGKSSRAIVKNLGWRNSSVRLCITTIKHVAEAQKLFESGATLWKKRITMSQPQQSSAQSICCACVHLVVRTGSLLATPFPSVLVGSSLQRRWRGWLWHHGDMELKTICLHDEYIFPVDAPVPGQSGHGVSNWTTRLCHALGEGPLDTPHPLYEYVVMTALSGHVHVSLDSPRRELSGRTGWEKFSNWECFVRHRQKGLFLSVSVDDIKLAGKKTKH